MPEKPEVMTVVNNLKKIIDNTQRNIANSLNIIKKKRRKGR